MIKVLFISHDAFRAGAQLLLLDLIKYFKNESYFEIEVLLKNGGDLYPEFAKLVKTHLWNIEGNTKGIYAKFLNIYQKKRLSKYFIKKKFDIIYCNTIANGELLKDLSFLKLPVVTHVHELSYWIEKCGKRNFEFIKNYTSHYIGVSKSVVDNLIHNYSIKKDHISLIYEYVDVKKIQNQNDKHLLKNYLKLSNSTIIIGACGAELWRKGKDLFIPLASQILKDTQLDIHFVWIGGELTYELQFDLEKTESTNRIHFINHLPNASKYFCDFDLFVMLSRDDPFPIVNLEVAVLGIPILCFENSGGSQELVDEFKEYLIASYLDINELSDKIIYLINNYDLRNSIGKALQNKVMKNYDIATRADEIKMVIKYTYGKD